MKDLVSSLNDLEDKMKVGGEGTILCSAMWVTAAESSKKLHYMYYLRL